MTKIFVFPGQGSQKMGMGADLFPRYRHEVAVADSILGGSIEQLCLEDPLGQLNQTEHTQPALYVVNALTYFDKLSQGAGRPDFVAGHSLGEYNALLAAGAFDFATGLRLVQQRGVLMGQARDGGMAAVIGLSIPEVRAVLADPRLEAIDIANLNSPSQVVISGPVAQIGAAQAPFKQAGARLFIPLKVSAAFHSRAMADAADEFRRLIEPAEFHPLQLPVISNVTARPYGPDQVRELLARQISSPVRWSESIEYLLGEPSAEFEEVGPGRVLTGLIRQIRAAAATPTGSDQ